MNAETAKKVGERVNALSDSIVLTDKDREVLGQLIATEPCIRGLASIVFDARQHGLSLVHADLGTQASVYQAALQQGRIQGVLATVEAFIALGIEPEESDEEGE